MIRVPIDALREGERVLSGEASHYLCRVLRLAATDRFVAFDPAARTEADGVVLEASATAARVRIETIRGARVVATTELVLVYALAKGDKVDAVVRDATELGATRIVLARAARSVVKLEDPGPKLDRWRRVAEQAARQCGRADPPEIEGVLAWADALDRGGAEGARFCLDPHATEPLGPALVASSDEALAFAIGPEGGLDRAEIAAAVAMGWQAVNLGPFVLRTETVAAAVLGAVRVLGVRALHAANARAMSREP